MTSRSPAVGAEFGSVAICGDCGELLWLMPEGWVYFDSDLVDCDTTPDDEAVPTLDDQPAGGDATTPAQG